MSMPDDGTAFRWSAAERAAWKPRKHLTPSAWAEQYRFLPRSQSARPGRWRNANAPYLRGIMDLIDRPGVSEVIVMKAAQVGGSEAIRNVMGCWSDQDPDPMGIALPDRDKGRKIIDNRLIPLYRKTPQLAEKLTGRAQDMQKGQLKLADHTIHLMWAGSPAALSSDPMRRAVCDEVDKFVDWVGREADAVSLVRKRLVTYEDRARLVCISTPTTKRGRISLLFDGCTIQLFFFVPCPMCGTFQRLVFPQIKWATVEDQEGHRLADTIESGRLAWYECEHCGGKIHEADKPVIVRAGRWQTVDGSVIDAEAVKSFPPGTRIGFQIAAWYALWVSFAEVAAEFIRAKGSLTDTFAFFTQTCGEPFEQRIKKATSSAFDEKCRHATLAEGILPRWAVRLIATIDTQHDHFWIVIRAWGPGLRSQRVYHSRVATFADLERLCWATPWAVEDAAFAPKTCDAVLIDSGGTRLEGEANSRTMEVYRWCQRVRRAIPIKAYAAPRGGLFVWDGEGFIRRIGAQKPQKIRLWHLAAHHFNDELQALIDDDGEDGASPKWQLNRRNDPEYNAHMSNVQKVARRRGRSLIEEWVPVTAGARIDYRDCEVYQVAAAYWANVHMLPADEEIQRMREAQTAAVSAARKPTKPVGGNRGFGVTSFGGYL